MQAKDAIGQAQEKATDVYKQTKDTVLGKVSPLKSFLQVCFLSRQPSNPSMLSSLRTFSVHLLWCWFCSLAYSLLSAFQALYRRLGGRVCLGRRLAAPDPAGMKNVPGVVGSSDPRVS